jgi:beta-lactamase regulating signal transducer with metallopeptidase domain
VSDVIVVTWMAALTRLAWLGCGMLALVRLRRCREAALLDDGVPKAIAGDARNVTVLWHPDVTQPVSFGLLWQLVLLPLGVGNLSADGVDGIIRHELLHVRRRDWGWHVMEEIVRALFWFHPAIWWATDRIRLSREQIIDALVVEATRNRRSYGNARAWPISHRAVCFFGNVGI